MMHLSPDEFVEAVEGTLHADRASHVDDCATCRAQAKRLHEVLVMVQSDVAPEPSPLFWEHFSARVHEAVASDAAPTRWSPRWLRWPVLAPIAALALLIVALATTLSRLPMGAPEPTVAQAPPPINESDSVGEVEWAALSELVGPLDLDAAQVAGIVSLGDAERAASQLTAEEQAELLRLLQEEMNHVGS